MRNVSIWENTEEWELQSTPTIIRMFQYKGNKRTLNEFLSPNYIHRGSQLAPRDLNQPGECTPFDLGVKGQVVLMGYSSITAAEEGDGQPFKVFYTREQAIHWLVKNFFYFYGDESATRRCRKAVSMDFDAENRKYQAMAREYEKNLVKPVTVVDNKYVAESPRHTVNIVPATKDASLGEIEESLNRKYVEPPVAPTPPASRVLNDQGAPVKQKVKKPTFMENMMKFLRLFKK
ncbi:hypothetical protein HYP84_gp088 [Shigella phage MK-13]|uniref:Uncharacterized protein n=1 Tax=Shigella phage MK-13 TaxID=2530042 RepID=A0A513QBJ3_9CAUD|nr:hypothetical protein HYP84_gp088 [Shigella phage MK-13]QBJ04321.1 hypothetical protein MK13_00088 [Shigella phage MK-13]